MAWGLVVLTFLFSLPPPSLAAFLFHPTSIVTLSQGNGVAPSTAAAPLFLQVRNVSSGFSNATGYTGVLLTLAVPTVTSLPN